MSRSLPLSLSLSLSFSLAASLSQRQREEEQTTAREGERLRQSDETPGNEQRCKNHNRKRGQPRRTQGQPGSHRPRPDQRRGGAPGHRTKKRHILTHLALATVDDNWSVPDTCIVAERLEVEEIRRFYSIRFEPKQLQPM